ncbi:MAG: hypothetical protein ABR912_03610 [Terracidiphilus sp.]
MCKTPDDSDLLVQFELDNIKDDYRLFYSIKRNNFFSSVQGFPELWGFFCRIDQIWRREIEDLEVAIDPNRTLPVVLYMNAHAKLRISMELAFSNCMPEARSILRDAVENVAHAHHMLRDTANQWIWMKKDEPAGKKAFKSAFEENKKTNLFADLTELHEKYGELSEAGSHPTLLSFANRVTTEDREGQRHMIVNYSGAPDRRLFALELFSRLLTCYVMERTFFEDYKTRLQLDGQLVQMRHNFEIFKENLRRELIVKYNVQPPPSKPTPR